MRKNSYKQIIGLINAQQKIIFASETPEERAEAFGFYAGYLNAMRMYGIITKDEYNALFESMRQFKEATSA